MSDYIKREDALGAFRRVYMIPGQGTAKEIYTKQIENTYKDIESIPTADVVEQKHGKWIECGEPNEHGEYELWYCNCDQCGAVGLQEYNFCYNCGADMRGDSDV